MKTLLIIIGVLAAYGIVIFSIVPNGDPNFGNNSTINGIRNFCRFLLVIGTIACFSVKFISCKRQEEFNEKAKICGLGYYDRVYRISNVIDSLCKHNRVKYGKLIINENELRKIYNNKKLPNDYIVGCRDTVSGDDLEIQLTVCQSQTYDGENYDIDYRNKIRKITLRNARGITQSDVRIDSDYLLGGQGFDRGYCATTTDTCAMLFEM